MPVPLLPKSIGRYTVEMDVHEKEVEIVLSLIQEERRIVRPIGFRWRTLAVPKINLNTASRSAPQ